MFHKVFVYGTLKKDEPNHHWFSSDNGGYFKLICEARTLNKYPLIIGTKYNVPFLLASPGDGTNVRGELYEVNDKLFADLDALEDHPNFYVRELQQVENVDDPNEKHECWIYFIRNFRQDLLTKATFEYYSCRGNHGLTYNPSDDDVRLEGQKVILGKH